MPIDQKQLFEILVCPSCGSPLTLRAVERIETSVQGGYLKCNYCQHYYRIEESKPKMILSEAGAGDKPFWVCNRSDTRHERFIYSWAEHHKVVKDLIPSGGAVFGSWLRGWEILGLHRESRI